MFSLDELVQEDEQGERTRLLLEADQCVDSCGMHGFHLDGFNLLGVVANPRVGGGPSATAVPRLSSVSVIPNRSMVESSGSGSTMPITPKDTDFEPGADPVVHADLFGSLETTLSQVTEQIENLNLFLEEVSRQYLGDELGESVFLEYYLQYEEEQTGHRPIPSQLTNLQLNSLQYYLEECGLLAHSLFSSIFYEETALPIQESTPSTQAGENSSSLRAATSFSGESELTDLITSSKLLLHNSPAPISIHSSNSLQQPTQQLVPLASPESLASRLDRVELALQAQVRQKAGAFFQETTRISQLKVGIVGLLQQVQTLRSELNQMLKSFAHVADMTVLDCRRQNYMQMLQVVDATSELMRCKASIGGLVSANDHIGAAEQIQYGRQLLNVAKMYEETVDRRAELIQLCALATSADQFLEYESLVVQNLSEQLIEAFLGWKANRMDDVVLPIIESLQLCGALPATGQLYIRRLHQVIRMTVRTTIAEFVDQGGVNGMSYAAFSSCLAMLFDELQESLHTAEAIDQFCVEHEIFQPELKGAEASDRNLLVEEASNENQSSRWSREALTSSAELASKSVAELLRLRKEAHALLTLDEMKQLWDDCLQFTLRTETLCNTRAVGLRSTLLGQAKSYLERTHETSMASLVAALDAERWTQCEISYERQLVLTRLCSGRAVLWSPLKHLSEDATSANELSCTRGESLHTQNKPIPGKMPTAEVEGVHYKVVWSCLLLVEMVVTNLAAAAHFQSLAVGVVAKVSELLRLFNARTTHLVLGAGAIHSSARLKSINAKHLSLVTQCLGMVLALFPHIRAALMAQLPTKQHTLLKELDKIKRDYVDHNEKVLNKFVTIIGGIVEHGLAPRIANTDFDSRAEKLPALERCGEGVTCCVFLDGVLSNIRKMHHVLRSLLPPDHLQDVFSRIFAYVDQKIPSLLIEADSSTFGSSAPESDPSKGTSSVSTPTFRFPTTNSGKYRLLEEVAHVTRNLNNLDGVHPWDFTSINVLERQLDVHFTVSRLHASCATDEVANSPTTRISALSDLEHGPRHQGQ